MSMQIGQAVMFLHSSNPPLAHLDIKPANILVCLVPQNLFVSLISGLSGK